MVSESAVYRDLMRFKPDGLTANAWAVRAGVSRTVWSDMRRHGNPSRRTLEKLLAAAGSTLAEFEALRIGDRPAPTDTVGARLGDFAMGAWTQRQLPPLPLIASSIAGEWGGPGSRIELTEIRREEIIDRVARPAGLAADAGAFAVTIVGDSMWPRFRPGRRIAVSPQAPIAIGDDVLVRLRGKGDSGELVLIKELVRRTSTVVKLRQFNPDIVFAVDAAEVSELQRIAGELI